MTLRRKDGFAFAFDPNACRSCPGHCCSGDSGYVWISPTEANALAEFLGLNALDFYREYTYRKDGKVSLKECVDGDVFRCVFFDAMAKMCRVYEARPVQCRTYPFWEWNKSRVSDLIDECPGIQV